MVGESMTKEYLQLSWGYDPHYVGYFEHPSQLHEAIGRLRDQLVAEGKISFVDYVDQDGKTKQVLSENSRFTLVATEMVMTEEEYAAIAANNPSWANVPVRDAAVEATA